MNSEKVAVVLDPHIDDRTPDKWAVDYFEESLNQLKIVSENYKNVLIPGDLLERPVLEKSCYNRLFDFFLQRKSAGNVFKAVPGNHDVFNNNTDTLERTDLYSFCLSRVLDIWEESFELCGVFFDVIPFGANPRVPKNERGRDVLIGHFYMDFEFDEKYSVKQEDVAKSEYPLVILGHDHEPYRDVNVGKSVVVRHGSVSRRSAYPYNLERVPQILEVWKDGESVESKKVTLEGFKKPSEIYREKAFRSDDERQSSKDDERPLSDLLSMFEGTSQETLQVESVMCSVGAEQKHLDYLEQCNSKIKQ